MTLGADKISSSLPRRMASLSHPPPRHRGPRTVRIQMCTRTKAASNNPLDNLAHCSYESGILEKPDVPAPKSVWTRTVGMFL